ncbi:hypothetical protein ACFX12_029900 [Malus domestica]
MRTLRTFGGGGQGRKLGDKASGRNGIVERLKRAQFSAQQPSNANINKIITFIYISNVYIHNIYTYVKERNYLEEEERRAMKLDGIEGHGAAEILVLVVDVAAWQNVRRIVDLPAIEADIFVLCSSVCFVSKP